MTGTPPQLGRPVGADGERTRRRIITATMRCVAGAGYSRTTIREIARAADMTSGSLYHYFPNKSALLEATVRELEQIALPRLRAAAARNDDVVDRLAAVLEESSRLMREYPDLAAFDRAIRAHHGEAREGVGSTHPGPKALREVIIEIIEDARAHGALPSQTSPQAAADVMHALTSGLTERAASLSPDAYAATVGAAQALIRGALFVRGAEQEAQRSS